MFSKEFHLALLYLVLGFLTNPASSQDVLFNLNTKKVVASTSDKFLSLTLDPAILLTGDVLTSSTELSANMAKALAPAYVRLAGPRSNSYTFERSLFPQGGYEDPDIMFSEAHWVLVQQWAQRAGLDVVSSLAPQKNENVDQSATWDPRNSLDLISFSDHMGYNMSWQLGYECQTRCDISGFDLGKDVARLRNILGAFPRYSNAVIAGPDIVSFRGKQQQQFIQDYLSAAGNALTAITWHPDFAGIAVDSDGVALQADTLATDRDLLYKAMGRSVAKKPLWIAESKPEECKRQFLGALVWARRLGNAAKLGVQVIMRQPDASNVFQPTPDYWVSLLHKMLVGREVLDAKLMSGNKSHVHFYCQCTKPSDRYDRGAVTIFGINLTPGRISVNLKGLKIKALHKYILMPGYDTDDRMFAETVLLNNEPLALVNGKNLPEINPAVSLMGKNMAVKLPSGGIGFWVIPGARVKSCLGHDEEVGDKNLLLKKLTKKLEDPEAGDENIGHEMEEDNHNQESEVESTEDIKSLLKSKKKRRKYRHSDEAEDDDRRFKRIDTKRELEKLEKLLKRNSNDEKKSSHLKARGGVGIGMFESGENKAENTSEEDAGLVRFKKNEGHDSGEEIRTKLEEYKNKLIEYEARRKNDDKIDDGTPRISSRRIIIPDDQFLNDIDAQKAVEALALISRVEGAIRDIGLSDEKNRYEEETKNLKPLNLAADIGEEMMIEELEKSDKTKRMIDPKSLGGKIYKFFNSGSQNKMHKRSLDEKSGVNLQRDKRDLEKLLGDDPLGLRKDGLFKKRLKTDEAKERRFERRNRKKEKDDIGIKKELPVGRYDPRITDSSENNFFGFPEMKPLENFPQGDVFLNEGSSSEEKSHDYDYVKDDDDEDDEATRKQQPQKKRRKAKNQRKNQVVQDETWVEEPNSNLQHAPNEFFERVNLPSVAIKTQWKNYGELYEPEALQQADFKGEPKVQENDAPVDTVIVKHQADEREDKRAKETAVKRLINYYDNSEVLRNDREEFDRRKLRPEGIGKEPKIRTKTPTQRKAKDIVKITPEEMTQDENTEEILKLEDVDMYEDSEGPGSLEFVNSKEIDDYSEEINYEEDDKVGAKKRTKRKIANLNFDVFGQEMIGEDAGNLKDCKCRVIRSTGKLECKNCRRNYRRRQREVSGIIPQEYITDPTSATSIDQTSMSNGSKNEAEEILTATDEAPEAILAESVPQDVSNSQGVIETSSDTDVNESSWKNTEVDDLNNDTTFRASINDESTPESSSPSTEDVESPIVGLNEAAESEIDLPAEPQAISGPTDGETGTEKSNDDVVGSQRLNYEAEENKAADQNSEPINNVSESVKDVEEKKEETVEIGKNISTEDDVAEDKNAKRQITASANADSETQSSTKFSLGTGPVLGSSPKIDLLETKLKNGVDLRLKSGGLKSSDFARSKLVLNTEALSALIKENESRKADVVKALESSSKLKSVENAKYAEYQKKREEKLATLKEKLRERKAKILQQYRQELLDALTKCDDEVERNLKRREIWDDFSKQEEFQDFVDKDKVAYLMMNRPINYEDVEERDEGFDDTEDRRYYPEIDVIQPLKSPRKQKIPSNEYRGFFYTPNPEKFSSSSSSQASDQSSTENADEPYYAIVESLEYPKLFHKQDFDVYKNEYDEFMKSQESELRKSRKQSKPEKFYQPEYRHPNHFGQRQYSDAEYAVKPVQRIHAVDGSNYYGGKPVLHLYEEDLSPEYKTANHYNEFPDQEGNVLRKTHQPLTPGPLNPRYESISSWDSLIPEYHDGILYHRQYLRPSNKQNKLVLVKDTVEDRPFHNPEKLTARNGVENIPDELFGNDIADVPLRDGWRIVKKLNSNTCSDGNCGEKINFGNTKELDESRSYADGPTNDKQALNHGEILVRNERHLIPHEKQVLDEPEYLSVRRERDVKEKQPNYVCLREDSTEDFGDDDTRIFKLVRNDDHYEAVPISDVKEDPSVGRQRRNHRRVAKQAENVRNKRLRYNSEVFTDEEGNYYLKNGGYPRRNLQKLKHSEDRELLSENGDPNSVGKFTNQYKNEPDVKYRLGKDEIDDINRLESLPRLTPEEYELLMLIPVKKHKAKRQKRDVEDNKIDRWESFEDTNSVWDVKKKENSLQEYVEAEEKKLRDFEEAQANLNKDLKELGETKDPVQVQNFRKVILNLGSHDQDKMAAVVQSQDDLDLAEYLKQEILKKLDDEVEKSKAFTPVPGTTTPSTLFDAAMPKLESTINAELENVANLTESLEDFINDFDRRFNTTSKIEGDATGTQTPKQKDKISHNIFHNAIQNVKKFFNFLAGISLIFGRH